MAEPRGLLITPVAFDADGLPRGLTVDADGYLQVAIDLSAGGSPVAVPRGKLATLVAFDADGLPRALEVDSADHLLVTLLGGALNQVLASDGTKAVWRSLSDLPVGGTDLRPYFLTLAAGETATVPSSKIVDHGVILVSVGGSGVAPPVVVRSEEWNGGAPHNFDCTGADFLLVIVLGVPSDGPPTAITYAGQPLTKDYDGGWGAGFPDWWS
ncbi:MAG: hypothetical protein K6T81_20395, partial [Alicyclobacillus macrosporangiidus]|uniref:hypothetical protein n=1 Tax=Alicyclobacillus macrosporangiidus TaxID=392015 RepID=UPI0026EE6B34